MEDAFGADIDYAQLQKIYGNEVGPKVNAEIRYSPAQCRGARKAVISGQPDFRARLHQPYRAAKPLNANGDAPVYQAHECLFKEGGELGTQRRPVFHALQLLPHSHDFASHASNGGGNRQHVWTMAEVVALIEENSN